MALALVLPMALPLGAQTPVAPAPQPGPTGPGTALPENGAADLVPQLSGGTAQPGPAAEPDAGGSSPVSPVSPAPVVPTQDQQRLPSSTISGPGGVQAIAIAPILTVDQDRLFSESSWGQRVQAQLEAEGQTIAAENTRLADLLAAEERTLTDLRATLDQAEFRRRAEAFDARATEVRRERAQAVQDLNARAEADRAAFYQAALPVMGDMMQARRAIAVLDRRTVFVSLEEVDITTDLIARLDETLGDGSEQSKIPRGTPDRPADAPADGPAAAATEGSAATGPAGAPDRAPDAALAPAAD
jgi:Skp family chaperone for outer membrane proteins